MTILETIGLIASFGWLAILSYKHWQFRRNHMEDMRKSIEAVDKSVIRLEGRVDGVEKAVNILVGKVDRIENRNRNPK